MYFRQYLGGRFSRFGLDSSFLYSGNNRTKHFTEPYFQHTRRTRGDEPAEGVFCSAFYASQISNLTQRVLVQISSKWLPCSLLVLLVGHHNFEISWCRGFSGPDIHPIDTKIFFPIFWNGQMHVHFELARCDFGDYLLIIITDMMENPM